MRRSSQTNRSASLFSFRHAGWRRKKRCYFGTLYTWYSEEQFWRCLLKSFWHVCSMPNILKTWEANITLTYGLLMSVWLVAMTFCLDYHIVKPTTQACGPWFRFLYSIGWNSRYSFAELEDEKFTILQPSYIHFDTLITASGKGRYILGRNVHRKVSLRVRKLACFKHTSAHRVDDGRTTVRMPWCGMLLPHLNLDAWQIVQGADRIDNSHTIPTSIDLRLPPCYAKTGLLLDLLVTQSQVSSLWIHYLAAIHVQPTAAVSLLLIISGLSQLWTNTQVSCSAEAC